MKHNIKKGCRVALLGENYFPAINDSHISKRRGNALQKSFGALLEHQPSLVYLCPTRGVNINLLPLLTINNIPFVLIFPCKHFLATLTASEKFVLDAATDKAQRIVILSEEKSSPLQWEEDWYKGTKRAVDSSDWVMVVHSPGYENIAFADLMYKFKKSTKPVLAVAIGEEPQ